MLRNSKGQQMVEYLLLLAVVIVIFVSVLYGNNAFRNRIIGIFENCIDLIADKADEL